jgi:hypothetical protein
MFISCIFINHFLIIIDLVCLFSLLLFRQDARLNDLIFAAQMLSFEFPIMDAQPYNKIFYFVIHLVNLEL